MKKKLLIFFLIIIFILIFIFIKFEYKNIKWGNNISKSDNIDILNISSYEAEVTVEVHSNKNINKYLMKQKYIKPNIFEMEVLEPNNIKGLTIKCDGENTEIENSLLDIKMEYENFNGKFSTLSLISFINYYKNGIESETEETENEIIMKTKINVNRYQTYQKLYLNKNSKLPTKMEILDSNKEITVYILYNEIKVNKSTENKAL